MNDATQMIKTMATLKNGIDKLKVSTRPFAQSLIAQFAKYGELSEKQAVWADKLADEIACFGVPDFTKFFEEPAPSPDYSAIVAFFAQAAKMLTQPAVTLQLKSGARLKLAMNGSKSSKPGHIKLTDGEAFGDNKFYGLIGIDGKFDPYSASTAIKNDLANLLAAFASDPVEVAAAHGKLTGRCCFCNTALEDPKSTAVGYGPTCAKVWGLPWGVASAKSALQAASDKLSGKSGGKDGGKSLLSGARQGVAA